MERLPPLDPMPNPSVCTCDELVGDSAHYPRQCQSCGHYWLGLHCPHEPPRAECSQCGARLPIAREVFP